MGAKGPIAGLIDTGADGTVLPAGYAPLMGYSPADIATRQGAGVGGSVTMHQATKPSKAVIPEIPDFEFEINPCFVEGCQIALWGRKDLMQHFDVHIMERNIVPRDIPACERHWRSYRLGCRSCPPTPLRLYSK
jgi:hypothetical protein